ncbi:MAG: proton-conducting transporter membrane subunit [Nitrospinota bacterium]|nr:monovalent cation/H+ antiporter subunit D family protein [Nitrospinota bacterium]
MGLLVATIFLTFAVAVGVALIGEKSDKIRNALLMFICIFDFAVLISKSKAILSGQLAPYVLANISDFKIAFQADALSLLMGVMITFLWILTTLYAIGYMSSEHGQTRFFTFLTICLGATLGVIFARDLITFYIFFEILTLAVYPLIIHEGTADAMRAGSRYLVFLLTGGVLVLAGVVLTYSLTGGNVDFTIGGIPQLAACEPGVLYALFACFVVGFGVKAALVPLHLWLPRAMVAPTPVSAVLHAVAVVNVGLYGFIRTVYHVFGPSLFGQMRMDTILAVPAAITIIYAAAVALSAKEIKKMLAYSTVNQLSYVILGVSSLHPIALLGALLHMLYHSIMKIGLFYSAGIIKKETGKSNIKDMAGMGNGVLPITLAAFTVGALGIIGLPPVAGYLSKWYLIKGFLHIGHPWIASVFIISSVMEIGYFVPPILAAYTGGRKGGEGADIQVHRREGKFEAPLSMLIPLVIVAILAIAFGFFGSLPFTLGRASVKILIP